MATGKLATWTSSETKTITVTGASVLSVAVTSDIETVAAGLPVIFTATATLSNGLAHIATTDGSEVDWTITDQPGAGASIDAQTGVLTTGADSVGTITVMATGKLATWTSSETKTIMVTDTAFELLMCGGELNDNDPVNAAGDCLKVATDGTTGMLFTGTPSLAVMTALEYVQSDGNNNTNGGKTYGSTNTESGLFGPAGSFAEFDQLLIDGDRDNSISEGGVNGQYDRWCKNLGDLGFNGRTDWRSAIQTELHSLYSTRDNMYAKYGWATYTGYWSSSVAGNTFLNKYLYDGKERTGNPTGGRYATCVSVP